MIGGQHGWWQSCPDLGLPGYDPVSSGGANINLVIEDEVLDPVSGAAPHRAYPCQLHKLDENSGWHPTAKPVGLLEFLIESYTRPGESVLDSTMGLARPVSPPQTPRVRFIGIEKDAEFSRMARELLGATRLESA